MIIFFFPLFLYELYAFFVSFYLQPARLAGIEIWVNESPAYLQLITESPMRGEVSMLLASSRLVLVRGNFARNSSRGDEQVKCPVISPSSIYKPFAFVAYIIHACIHVCMCPSIDSHLAALRDMPFVFPQCNVT